MAQRTRTLALGRAAMLAGTAIGVLGGIASTALPAFADEAADTASTIVVTAAGREQEIKYAPASISIITREELEQMPYREVTDALYEIPGVTVSMGEGNSKDVSIRGMGGKYTLILVDGKRLSSREARTNGGNVSEGGLLPPLESIERIEVIRGPMSSLYGSDAMGGVVNVITRRVSDRWRGSVRMNGTGQLASEFGNLWDGNFYLAGPVVSDVVGIQLFGSMSRRDEDSFAGGTPERDDDSLGAKLAFNLSDQHSLIAEGNYFRQDVTQRYGTGGSGVVDQSNPEGTVSRQLQKRYVGSLSHSGDWGFATSESYVQHEDAKNITSEKRIKNTVAQSIWAVPIGNHNLTFGGYYRYEDLTDLTGNGLRGSTVTGISRESYAAFSEAEIRLAETVALTGGLRYDHDEKYGASWTPRAYLVWNPTDALTVKGGYSEGFRAPDLRQTEPGWGQTSRGGTMYGNPDLKAETSATYEASVLYSQSRFSAGVTIYQTDFDNKILRLTCEEAGAWCVDEPLSTIGRKPTTYTNVDKARIRGLELTLEVPVTETVMFKGTATLLDSEQLTGDNKGKAVNDTPKQQLTASLDWRPNPATSLYIRSIYRGEERQTETQISGSNKFAPGYNTVDIGGSYRLNDNVSVYGGVMNLFDKRLNLDEFDYAIDGARVWVGLGARF